MSITESYIDDVVKQIASNCNLKNVRYIKQQFETIAQNYFGVIVPIVLIYNNDGSENKINLVLKLAPSDERFRVSGAVTLMFAREIYVYSVILKKYAQVQLNFSPDTQFIVPKSYYVCENYCKEAIAIQDMCTVGYKPFTKQMFLDLKHITTALESLAKLHALSYILKTKDFNVYKDISNICVPISEKTNKRFMDIMTDRLDKAIQKFDKSKYVPFLKYMRENCAKSFDNVIELTQSTCICHCDIWKENVLFKYKDESPISACIIDYQTTRISCPAFDTLYLIISSTNAELRHDNYYKLLDIYCQMFAQSLKQAGLESQVIYSREMFDKDLKIVWPACFITANTALWLSSGLQEEGHVRSKHIWTNAADKEKAVNSYKTIIKAIIDNFIDYEYLKLDNF